ncbi:hypothetical protein F383_31297 [Gossypium arboreum]|uniref:Uncharacterized protein n=1 Tax=Gossypium arboreum TaxID=29729 RepID=A0A0B0PEW9_GOSAR|nr:hypothetical protein F383_31297 [Gossypium arboreum]
MVDDANGCHATRGRGDDQGRGGRGGMRGGVRGGHWLAWCAAEAWGLSFFCY